MGWPFSCSARLELCSLAAWTSFLSSERVRGSCPAQLLRLLCSPPTGFPVHWQVLGCFWPLGGRRGRNEVALSQSVCPPRGMQLILSRSGLLPETRGDLGWG